MNVFFILFRLLLSKYDENSDLNKKMQIKKQKFGIKVVSLGDNKAKSNLKSLALSIILVIRNMFESFY